MDSSGGGGPPASTNATRTAGSSDNRAASTAPADPPPTTTTSNGCSATRFHLPGSRPHRSGQGTAGGWSECGTRHTTGRVVRHPRDQHARSRTRATTAHAHAITGSVHLARRAIPRGVCFRFRQEGRASPNRPGPSATGRPRSRSSARRDRSTPQRLLRSPSTPGSAPTPTSATSPRGAAPRGVRHRAGIWVAGLAGPSHSAKSLCPGVPTERRSEREMKAQRLIESYGKIAGKSPQERPDTLDRDGPDLLRLSLRVPVEAGARSIQQRLERIDAGHCGGDWYDRDHTSPQAFGCGVGAVVAHDDGWPPLARLGTSGRVEIHQPDLASAHQLSPSPTADSHSSASEPAAHSAHACS